MGAGETFIRLIESLGALKDFSETREIDALMARIFNSMQEQIEDYKAVETFIRLIELSLALNFTGGTVAHLLVKEVCDLSPVSSSIQNRPIVCETNQEIEILWALKVFSEAGEAFIRQIEFLGALNDFSKTGGAVAHFFVKEVCDLSLVFLLDSESSHCLREEPSD